MSIEAVSFEEGSRVRIPVTMIFDVLQGINRVMTSYEQRYGEIRRRDE